MSQFKFKAITSLGIAVEVIAGWDPPLGYFFLTLFYQEPPKGADSDLLWSTVDEVLYPNPKDKISSVRLQNVLKDKFGIVAPKGFWENVDKKQGNVLKLFEYDKNSLN